MQSSSMKVTDLRVARVFLLSDKRRLLLELVEKARTVTEAAALLQRPVSWVHYHVMDLLDRGLVRVEWEKKRGGRPIKYYRAVSAEFKVPVELLEVGPGARLAAELRASLDEQLFQSEDAWVHFYVEEGRPKISKFGGRDANARAAEFWQVVFLTEDEVRSFRAELQALMNRYKELPGPGTPYLLHAAFAPRRQS